MRVRFFPCSPNWLASPYLSNLLTGLAEHDVEVVVPASAEADWLSGRWLRANPDGVDILHFHWTSYHYTRETWKQSFSELMRFVAKLALARHWGYKIVWTMHNYMPHERPYPLLHYLERLSMAHLSHSIVVHCRLAQELVARSLFRRHQVFCVPHGDYGAFLNHLPRPEARARLDIPQHALVLIFFGAIRPYKGVPGLLRAFRQIEDDRLVLLVVGRPADEALAREITSLAGGDPRIRTALEFLPDAELSVYLSAADIAVFPYLDVLTSGAAITALSFGLPVIAPRIGCLPEVVTDGAGILYDPLSEGLDAAIRQCFQSNLALMQEAARARARELSWGEMVRRTAEVYRRTCEA